MIRLAARRYVMRGRRAHAALFAGAVLLAGCGANAQPRVFATDGESPGEVVATTASQTFSEPALELSISVASEGAGYRASGLMNPERGRFRVELADVDSRSEVVPRTVIGLEGEGFESTVSVGPTPDPAADQRCWFNPHAPVGSFLGTASVEESVRLLGSTLESLRGEIDTARELAPGSYAVTLKPSAAKPEDDFRDSPERVWGDRRLFNSLAGPMAVELDETATRVARLVLELSDYEVYDIEAGQPKPTIDSVRIEAVARPSQAELAIDQPNCQAME